MKEFFFIDPKKVYAEYEKRYPISLDDLRDELNIRNPRTGKLVSRQALRNAIASQPGGPELLKQKAPQVRESITVQEFHEYLRHGATGKVIPARLLTPDIVKGKIVYGDIPVSLARYCHVMLWDVEKQKFLEYASRTI